MNAQAITAALDAKPVNRGQGETADRYPSVVAQINRRWRVILCSADAQWILQRHDGERGGTARWVGVGYCLTREALLRLCRASCGPVSPSISEVLDNLPAHITRGQQ